MPSEERKYTAFDLLGFDNDHDDDDLLIDDGHEDNLTYGTARINDDGSSSSEEEVPVKHVKARHPSKDSSAPSKAAKQQNSANSKAKESSGSNTSTTKDSNANPKKFQKKPKFNPFAKALAERELEKARIEKERQEAQQKREEAQSQREKYYKRRDRYREKMMKKTTRGQPVLNNQVNHLLSKIKKSLKEEGAASGSGKKLGKYLK